MSKHTPGPWRAEQDGEGFWNVTCDGTGFEHFVVGNEGFYMGNGCDEANARLTAAAPDLFSSVEMLLEYAEMYLGLCDDDDAAAEAVIAVAKASIKKARGE